MANSNSLPVKVDFKIKQGDTFKRGLIHQYQGENVDMSTVVPVFIFKSDTIDNLTLGNGLSWGGADNHILYIHTQYVWDGTVPYELQYTYSSGDIQTPIEGKVKSKTQIEE